MRQADYYKQRGQAADTRQRVEGLERNRPELAAGPGSGASGSAIVLAAVAYGRGSICDIEVLSDGRATGVRAYDAVCHDKLLAAGDKVQWSRRADGGVELIAGGGGAAAGGGGTTTIAYVTYVSWWVPGP